MATREPSPESADSPVKTCRTCGETKPEIAFYLKHASRYPGLRMTVCKACDSLRKRLNLAANRDEINRQRQERRALNREERNAQARAWLAHNAERINVQRRAQRAADPEKERAKQRARRAKDPEKYRAYDRGRSTRRAEARRIYEKARYDANKELFRAQQHERRAVDPERYQRYEATKRLKHRDKLLERSRRGRNLHGPEWNARKRARYASNRQENAAKIRQANRAWRKANPEKFVASSQRRGIRRRAILKGLPALFTEEDRQFCYQYFGYACAVCGHEEGFQWGLSLDHWIAINTPASPGSVPWNLVPLCNGLGGCNNSKRDKPAQEWLIARLGARKAKQISQKIEVYFKIVRHRQEPHDG